MSDPAAAEGLLDKAAVAAMWRVHPNTVDHRIKTKKFLPGRRIGNVLRWRREDAEQYLLGKRDWSDRLPFAGREHFRLDVPSAERAQAVARRLLMYGFADFETVIAGNNRAVLIGLQRDDVGQTAADLRCFLPDVRWQFIAADGTPGDLAPYVKAHLERAGEWLR